jgi:hypothetical protein
MLKKKEKEIQKEYLILRKKDKTIKLWDCIG